MRGKKKAFGKKVSCKGEYCVIIMQLGFIWPSKRLGATPDQLKDPTGRKQL